MAFPGFRIGETQADDLRLSTMRFVGRLLPSSSQWCRGYSYGEFRIGWAGFLPRAPETGGNLAPGDSPVPSEVLRAR